MEELGLELDVFSADLNEIKTHPEYSPVAFSIEKGYANRPNVIGKLRGSMNGRSLLLMTHCDTVPIGPIKAWRRDPLGGEIVDGRLHGRGAYDHKSGIIQMLMATAGIIDANIKLLGDLTLMSTIEEEAGGGGGALACMLRGYSADAGIYTGIGRNGLESIRVSCGGVLYFKIVIPGKMAHGGRAHLGVNAIGKAMKIYQALDELDNYRGLNIRNPLIENAYVKSGLPPRSTNLVIGMIKGGNWPSTVPAECELNCRIGFPPGETIDSIKTLIEEYISSVAKADLWLKENPPEIKWFGWKGNPASVKTDDPIVKVTQDCIQDMLGNKPTLVGSSSGSDTRFFTLYADTPTIALGCRGGGTHMANEWVDIESLIETTKAIALIILEWCGYEV